VSAGTGGKKSQLTGEARLPGSFNPEGVRAAWTSPASMADLEAAVERIQKLRVKHLAAHHVVNSFVRHDIASLQ
jgi:hypothetical protein